jgi:methyl-accepting chemotaxis protein
MPLPSLRGLTLRTKLTALVALLSLGVICILGAACAVLAPVRIGGRVYARIVLDRDLAADALPPPLLVVGAYAAMVTLAADYDQTRREGLVARLETDRREFEAAHAVWVERVPELRGALDAVTAPAVEFFAHALKELVPAVRDGDAFAVMRARDAAAAAFERHAAANADLVRIVRSRIATDERDAASLLRGRTLTVASLVATLLAAVVLVALAIARNAERQVVALEREARAVTDAVAVGRLGARLDEERVGVEFRGFARSLNAAIDACARPLALVTERALVMARGEPIADRDVALPGEFARAGDALDRCAEAVATVRAEVERLVAAATRGDLSARGDPGRLEGAWAQLVTRMNGMLDALLRPIGAAAATLDRIAARDLVARVGGAWVGDHARVTAAVDATAEALAAALRQVSAAVGEVGGTARSIAAAGESVASGAAQQARALEGAAARLSEVASSAARTAEEARAASASADGARSAAQGGAAAVEALAAAIERVRSAAERTASIIKEVREIAMQTNLLALNAAVEAARAGEAGAGFAVVAGEVGGLARRAREAADRTEQLIGESLREACAGAALARDASARLGEIVAAADRVTANVGEIAGAAQSQAAGVAETERALALMREATHEHAASAEQTSAGAAALTQESDALEALVRTFVLSAPARRPEVDSGAISAKRRPSETQLS